MSGPSEKQNEIKRIVVLEKILQISWSTRGTNHLMLDEVKSGLLTRKINNTKA